MGLIVLSGKLKFMSLDPVCVVFFVTRLVLFWVAQANKELDRHNEEHDYDGEEDELAELLGDGESDNNSDQPGKSCTGRQSSHSSCILGYI